VTGRSAAISGTKYTTHTAATPSQVGNFGLALPAASAPGLCVAIGDSRSAVFNRLSLLQILNRFGDDSDHLHKDTSQIGACKRREVMTVNNWQQADLPVRLRFFLAALVVFLLQLPRDCVEPVDEAARLARLPVGESVDGQERQEHR
jgi:hypothetical protein